MGMDMQSPELASMSAQLDLANSYVAALREQQMSSKQQMLGQIRAVRQQLEATEGKVESLKDKQSLEKGALQTAMQHVDSSLISTRQELAAWSTEAQQLHAGDGARLERI